MWIPTPNKRASIGLKGFFVQIARRAWGKLTIRNLLSMRKWRYLFERIKREITLHRQNNHRPTEFIPLSPTAAYLLNNTLRPELVAMLREAVPRFGYLPTISILMPVYNVDPTWLNAAIQSVLDQIYPHWELCIADDASTRPETLQVLQNHEGRENIKIVYRSENGHICAASNSAAELATGDFVVLLDNDDRLAPHALFEIVRLLNIHPDADLIYSDEDKIDTGDRHYDLHFKPDWSPTLLLGYNYINHLTCLRRSLFEAVGRFTPGFEGAQDYDLLFRVSERTDRIHHIPKILYHWRSVPESTASAASVKPIVETSAHKALKNHLDRQGIMATPYQPNFAKLHGLPINQLDWSDTGPRVEIIVYGGATSSDHAACINSIQNKTSYKNYEITPCFNDLGSLNTPFHLPVLLNAAGTNSQADLLLFLDGNTRVTEPKWLSRLVGYLSLPGVAVAGARLLDPNKRIIHAGTVFKPCGNTLYFPAFSGESSHLLSYFFLAETARECAAVSSACLLTRRSDFVETGGFNEGFRQFGFELDYSLRCARRGLRTVCITEAGLTHTKIPHETSHEPADKALLHSLLGHYSDPFYNPNLLPPTLSANPACHLDYEEFIEKPLKCVFFTHNLNLEGAPKVIINLAISLHHNGHLSALMVSPEMGPASELLNQANIPYKIIRLAGCHNILSGWADAESFNATLDQVEEFLRQEKPDVLIVNVLNSFFMIEAAARLNIPCLWIIHESYHRELFVRAIDSKALPICQRTFAKANSVVFVSDETRKLYMEYNQILNFTVIHNALSKEFLETPFLSKDLIRNDFGIAPNKKVILSIGTVCERKDQKTLVRAIELLAKTRDDFVCFIVGWRHVDGYSQQVSNLVVQLGLTEQVILVPETKDVVRYYAMADIFAFTSLNESYSLTILEALSFGLPILTTPCVGIAEQVQFGLNALRFDFHDSQALSDQLALLLDDTAKRTAMGEYSRQIFESMPTYDDVVQSYRKLIWSAWQAGNPANKM